MNNASKLVTPTTEVINEVKTVYNNILNRHKEAEKFLDNPKIPQQEKDKHIIQYKVEISDVLESYLKILQDWGVSITNNEILGGLKIE